MPIMKTNYQILTALLILSFFPSCDNDGDDDEILEPQYSVVTGQKHS